ncbi:MAG TPA: RluA family pseudouridine synthase [Chthoniobacterales bacterium]
METARTEPACRGYTLLFENEDFLVLDKAPGLLVHPTKPGPVKTLWHHLRELLAYELVNGGQISLINRLDRETSGVMLVAKKHESARALHLLLQRQQVRKRYSAIVYGWPSSDRFTVDAPLLRQGSVLPSSIWLKRTVHPSGYRATTEFWVRQRFERAEGRFALIEARPLTGRTHQIRTHLAHARHPLVGDKIYGPDETFYLEFIEQDWTPRLQAGLHLRRHALHAAELAFTLEGQSFCFAAPLPPDLAGFMETSSAAA